MTAHSELDGRPITWDGKEWRDDEYGTIIDHPAPTDKPAEKKPRAQPFVPIVSIVATEKLADGRYAMTLRVTDAGRRLIAVMDTIERIPAEKRAHALAELQALAAAMRQHQPGGTPPE